MKTFNLIFALIFISVVANAQAPAWQWAKSANNNLTDDATKIALDRNSNAYVVGSFGISSITLGTSSVANYATDSSFDIFIAKYDALGNVLWAKGAGGTGNDFGYSIAADVDGNTYITGVFTSKTLQADNFTLHNADTTGKSFDAFLIKYNTDGNVIWAKSFGGTTYEYGNDVTVDNSGNPYITGSFLSDSIIFDTTTLINARPHLTGFSIYAVKFDTAGHVIWAKGAQQPTNDFTASYCITTDNKGNAFINGLFNDSTFTFDGINVTNTYAGGGDNEFLIKINSAGKAVWAKTCNGVAIQVGSRVATDADGNILLTGLFADSTFQFGNITLKNNAYAPFSFIVQMFLGKYDSSGNELWAIGSTGNSVLNATCVKTDAQNNIYLSGNYNKTFNLGNGNMFNVDTAYNSYDFFMAKLNPAGNITWTTNQGGNGSDYLSGFALDDAGNIFTTGVYSDTLALGSNILTDSYQQRFNIFVARLGDFATDIAQPSNPSGTIIYPNPTSGIFNLTTSGNQPATLTITNVLGEQVYFSPITSNNTQINLSHQPKGIYFYRLQGGNNTAQTGKVIIE